MASETATDTARLLTLSPEHCLRLLRGQTVHVGRIGMTGEDGQPLVIPVNYRLDGDTVVFRTEPGSLLATCAAERRVAFEADEVDGAWREGWSVLIQGTAYQVTDLVEIHRLRRLPLRPWAPGDRSLYVRIVPAQITGRQIA